MTSLTHILADYHITAETLWAIFFRPSTYCISQGDPPVMHAFALADAGPVGLGQIRARDGDGLLTTLSLADVRAIASRLGLERHGDPRGMVLFTQSQDGVADLILSSEGAPNRALLAARAQCPDRLVAIVGTIQDFRDVWGEMEKILQHQDFASIKFDRRPPTPACSSFQLLLLAKKNPSSELIYAEMLGA